MTAVATKRPRYTDAEIDKVLTALILHGGNYRRTEQFLGGKPSNVTIRDWRKTHAERYAELQQELAPQIAERLAADAEELMFKAAQVQHKAIDVALEKIEDADAEKAAGIARNMATVAALNNDKIASPLRGRPTVVHGTEDSHNIFRSLARAAGVTIDSTAEEMPLEREEAPQRTLPRGT